MKIVTAIIRKVCSDEDDYGDKAVTLNIDSDYGETSISFSLEYSHKKELMGKFDSEFTVPQKQLKKFMAYTGAKSFQDLTGKSFRAILSGQGGLGNTFIGFGHATDNDFVLTKSPNLFEEVRF